MDIGFEFILIFGEVKFYCGLLVSVGVYEDYGINGVLICVYYMVGL